MEGTFESGDLLYIWYDQWASAGALVVVGILTIVVLARTSWNKVLPLVAKTISTVSTVIVAVVVFDRAGARFGFDDPEVFGYTSVGAAGLATFIGLITLLATRGRSAQAAATAGFATGIGDETPEGGTDVTGLVGELGTPESVDSSDDETMMAGGQPGEAATMIVGGAGATVHSVQQVKARLTVRNGAEMGQSFDLMEETTIGRSSDNHWVLSDPTISRNHCTITRDGDEWVIEDTSSTGTSVDGIKTKRQVLHSGNVLLLGETEVTFESNEKAADDGQATVMGTASTVAAPAAPSAPTSGATVIMTPGQTANAWFIVRKGAQAGQTFNLTGERASIGRDAGNDVRVEDDAVSREHAVIDIREGKYTLRDIGSTGGTVINGAKLGGLPLKDGSVISIGATELVFSSIEGGAQPSAGGGGETVVMRAAASRGVLLVRSGPAAGKSISIADDDVVLGREPGDGGMPIDDPGVSRRHAIVRRAGDAFTVADLGSANGTSVDGTQIPGRELQDGDTVTLGATELQFVRAHGA